MNEELTMKRSIPMLGVAALFGVGIAAAQASDSQRLAENGGFLLGHAHRCGISNERVIKAGRTIQNLIAATAADPGESVGATARFAEFFLATSSTDAGEKELTPACKKVIAEFKKLERHRLQVRIKAN